MSSTQQLTPTKRKVELLDGPFAGEWRYAWGKGDELPELIAVFKGGVGQVSMVAVDAWPWCDRASCEADGDLIYRRTRIGYVVDRQPQLVIGEAES